MKHLIGLSALTVSRQPEEGTQTPLTCARVAMAGQRAALEWTPAEIDRGSCLDPLRYPLTPGLIEARSDMLGGLHGFLADSLPDAWGMRLLARRLRRDGIKLETLSCVQRLSLVGHHGRGALLYDPCDKDMAADLPSGLAADIDGLARAASLIMKATDTSESEPLTRLLELLGSGSGGARPKSHVDLDGEAWIVKFPGPSDPVDIGPIEEVYLQMARACGLNVMPSRLIASSQGPGWFATKRFDRTQGGGRIHMVSLCGALEAPSGITAIGYDTFLRATMAISRNAIDVEAVFLRMIFNILACNRDDHSRQHAFLQDTQGNWRLAPAFDLTFSHGPGGEHELDIDGEARRPTRSHVLNLAKRHGVATQKIDRMIDAARFALAEWDHLAKQTGVSATSRIDIATTLAKIDRDFQS
jgi:serine/threonine-protein kinase HipA